jgi:hypothetical protein
MGLQAGDHPALVFLHRELLPFLIAGRKVRRRWFVRLDRGYRYTGDLAAALAGMGLGGPLIGAIAHSTDPGHGPGADVGTRLTEQLGRQWGIVGVVAVVVWVVVRLVVQNENIAQRATLAKQFAVDNEISFGKLFEALRGPKPRDGILEVHRATMDRVQTALTKDIWPFETYRPPPAAVQPELNELTDEIRTNHMRHSNSPQPGQEWW